MTLIRDNQRGVGGLISNYIVEVYAEKKNKKKRKKRREKMKKKRKKKRK